MDQSYLEINNQSSLNRPELATNYNYVEYARPNAVTGTDMAVLTSNQLPNPISPEGIPENAYKIPHQKLVLQLSEPSQKSAPMVDSFIKRPVMRVKSVTTPGGRVVRNISMNNSVKYDISTAYEKYSAAFSSYKNPFRTGLITQDQQQPQPQPQPRPSLRRDGQVRRASRHERADSSSVVISSRPSTFTHQTSTDSCTSVTSNTQL